LLVELTLLVVLEVELLVPPVPLALDDVAAPTPVEPPPTPPMADPCAQPTARGSTRAGSHPPSRGRKDVFMGGALRGSRPGDLAQDTTPRSGRRSLPVSPPPAAMLAAVGNDPSPPRPRPRPRLRVAVHPAHRPAHPRGRRLLRDPPLQPPARRCPRA